MKYIVIIGNMVKAIGFPTIVAAQAWVDENQYTGPWSRYSLTIMRVDIRL